MPGKSCAVRGCINNYYKNKYENQTVSFFKIPRDCRSQIWLEKCNNPNINPSTGCICSDHFKESDFERDLQSELLKLPLRKLLKKDAIPSLKLPEDKTTKKDQVKRVIKKPKNIHEEELSGRQFTTESDIAVDPAHLENICRTCLQSENLILIDEVVWEDMNLRTVLGNWILFDENRESLLPQNICQACMTWCFNAHEFITKVQKNDKILKHTFFPKTSLHEKTLSDVPRMEPEGTDIDFLNEPAEEDNDTTVIKEEPVEKSEEPPHAELSLKVIQQKFKIRGRQYQFARPEQKDNLSELNQIIDEQEVGIVKLKAGDHSYFRIRTKDDESSEEEEPPEEILDDEGDPESRITNKLYPFNCQTCGKGFNKIEKFKNHKKANKHKGSIYCCIYCGKTDFEKGGINRLRLHIRTHTKETPYVCELCGKSFKDPSAFRRHVYNIHEQPPNLYVCKICSAVLRRKDTLAEHERRCQGLEPKRPKTKVPPGPSKVQCEECGKLIGRTYLWIHMQEHTSEGGVNCDICGKPFSCNARLKYHKKYSHSEQSFMCHTCGFTTKHKATLEKHVKQVHEGQRFSCSYCNKVFQDRNYYRAHLRVHNNDTKYQCKICSLICVTNQKLRRHLDTHSSVKRHMCTKCGKQFASTDSLKLHAKTHEGPPTHKCIMCPKGYYLNCLLQKHIRLAHNTKIKDVKKNDDKEVTNDHDQKEKNISEDEEFEYDKKEEIKSDDEEVEYDKEERFNDEEVQHLEEEGTNSDDIGAFFLF